MRFLTREQVRRVDRVAIERYHVPGVVLMENAARGASDVAMEMLGSGSNDVLVLCGGGNNGGDGLAVARHLHNAGHQVVIGLCTDPRKYHGDAMINWRIVEAMNLQRLPWEDAMERMPSPRLVVDAVFGTGLTEAPRAPFGQIVDGVMAIKRPILAIDIPSGLDCDSGKPLGPCIRATRTVTFVAQKIGFNNPESKQFTGEVTVADIGCPREAIDDAIRMNP